MIVCFCSREALSGAVRAMKAAHPYETPAFFVHEHIDVE
jgi:hypothetical protein